MIQHDALIVPVQHWPLQADMGYYTLLTTWVLHHKMLF